MKQGAILERNPSQRKMSPSWAAPEFRSLTLRIASERSQLFDMFQCVVLASSPAPKRPNAEIWQKIRNLDLPLARQSIDSAEESLFATATNAGRPYGDLLALRAVTLALQDDTLNAAAVAAQALRWGCSDQVSQLSVAVMDFAAWKSGSIPILDTDLSEFEREPVGLLRPKVRQLSLAAVLRLTLAATVEFSQLKVARAEVLARYAVRMASRASSAIPVVVLARILYEQGRLEEAERMLRSRISEIRKAAPLDCVAEAYAILARLSAHKGDLAKAFSLLEEGSRIANARDWPRLLAALLAERVRLCQPGDEKRVSVWLNQLRNLEECHRAIAWCAQSDIAGHLAKAEIYFYLSFGAGPAPLGSLSYLQREARRKYDVHAASWVKIAAAQVLWAAGDRSRSVEFASEALRAGQASGLRQQLLDAGPSLCTIIDQLFESKLIDATLSAYADDVMDGIQDIAVRRPQRTSRSTGIGEYLTTREQDVLKSIGEGQTNKMIAQSHGVAPETVKTHIKNIFVKLGVERRAQAVIKAQRLGIIGF